MALGQIVPGFDYLISAVRLGGGFDPAAMGLGCALPRFDSAVWASDGSSGTFSGAKCPSLGRASFKLEA
jgi:hypothetical protein